jgi:hypothetical protein
VSLRNIAYAQVLTFSGEPLLLRDGDVIGSDAKADVRLDDPRISRFHAEVRLRPDGLWIRSPGGLVSATHPSPSPVGTQVSGVRLGEKVTVFLTTDGAVGFDVQRCHLPLNELWLCAPAHRKELLLSAEPALWRTSDLGLPQAEHGDEVLVRCQPLAPGQWRLQLGEDAPILVTRPEEGGRPGPIWSGSARGVRLYVEGRLGVSRETLNSVMPWAQIRLYVQLGESPRETQVIVMTQSPNRPGFRKLSVIRNSEAWLLAHILLPPVLGRVCWAHVEGPTRLPWARELYCDIPSTAPDLLANRLSQALRTLRRSLPTRVDPARPDQLQVMLHSLPRKFRQPDLSAPCPLLLNFHPQDEVVFQDPHAPKGGGRLLGLTGAGYLAGASPMVWSG